MSEPIREHAVTITLGLPDMIPHMEVQSRVLSAVDREFKDVREDALCVQGYDRKKHEVELERVTMERNEFYTAWVEAVQRARR